MRIRLGHTPDADDAFMFHPIVNSRIDLRGFEIEHVIEDIETLNKMAFSGELHVTAISVHTYPYISTTYRILSSGASVGRKYGPVVVSKEEDMDLKGRKIAIPGKYTTASLLLSLAVEEFIPVEVRFDRIIEEVKKGRVDAGLLIHEGQITYEGYGLKCVLDLSRWWDEKTSLPIPLGINVIRRDIPEKRARDFLELMRESILYSLNHVDEALNHAMKFARGSKRELVRDFVLMYVNDDTVEMPPDVEDALKTLLKMGAEKGLFKKPQIDILR